MNPFLYSVAKTYYQHWGDNIHQCAFVFPNRRSGIFFQQYLAQVAGKPLFSPPVYTINDFMVSLSQLRPVDKLELLFTIYEEYIALRQIDEPFDKFVFWGEMLAADFDDVDKYMIDASQLFSNIAALKDIEMDYLTPEQIAIIRQFWDIFIKTTDTNPNKVEFNTLWNIMCDLYLRVRDKLRRQGVGYEGMIFRDVAMAATNGNLPEMPYQRIVFVGFNAITEAERTFMKYLRLEGKGDFYWDYDAPMLHDRENKAGYFVVRNIEEFPSLYDIDAKIIDSIPEISVIQVASGVGQTKQAGAILQKLVDEGHINVNDALNTAVILPDESLLVPMLYSVPQIFPSINITMGYPLSDTSIATLLDIIYQLQKRVRWSSGEPLFYYQSVITLLNHRFIKAIAGEIAANILCEIKQYNKIYVTSSYMHRHPLLSLIFKTVATAEEASQYLQEILLYLLNIEYTSVQADDENEESMSQNNNITLSQIEHEFIYNYTLTVRRLSDVMQNHSIVMNVATYFSLLGKISTSVPFEGEPLSGLQIMGVLETRVLDFENIIILSANEGVFPKKKVAASFIPYNLRRGFGLSTTEHQDSIYAYYFYRMLGRAKRMYLLYDSRTEGPNRGEVSRYVYQLRYHYARKINHLVMNEMQESPQVMVDKTTPITIPKSEGVMQHLNNYLEGGNKSMSASSVNLYLTCPLRFYLEKVEGLREGDDVKETIGGDVFGTIYHGVMQTLYDAVKDKTITESVIDAIIKDKSRIEQLIASKISTEFFNRTDGKVETLQGQYRIVAHIIKQYVEQTLKNDRIYTPFTYIASEMELKDVLLPLDNGHKVRFRAFVDRLDCVGNELRIIDYKTGSDILDFQSVESLFDVHEEDRAKAILQVLLYCKLYRLQYPNDKRVLRPCIYKTRMLFENFSPYVSYNKDTTWDYDVIADDYERALDKCLSQLFDASIPFEQTPLDANCKYCPFKSICKR